MQFDLESPGLIILNQYTTYKPQENIHNYWYISREGIEYFKSNLGNLSHINLKVDSLLDLITQNLKTKFEYAFDKVDLGFFQYWSCLQIQFHAKNNKTIYSNINRFLEHYNIQHSFNETDFSYHFDKFPNVKTHLDVYGLVNQHIENDLITLFKKENIAHCILNMEDFKSFSQYENKIEFLEKFRFKEQLENQFPVKQKKLLKKI